MYCKVNTLDCPNALRLNCGLPEWAAARANPSRFVVSVHDIAPPQAVEVTRIFQALKPLVSDVISAAVIPRPAGAAWGGRPHARRLRRLVSQGAQEVVAHGWAHRRDAPLDWFSRVIGCCDEFAGLDEATTGKLLGDALRATRELFGKRVRGFVAPGWRSFHAPAFLGEEALGFVAGWSRLYRIEGPALRLATWSWDAGPIAALGLLAELGSRWQGRRRGAIPVIAIHPADVRRGFLPRALARVKQHLERGDRPVVFEELAGASEVPC